MQVLPGHPLADPKKMKQYTSTQKNRGSNDSRRSLANTGKQWVRQEIEEGEKDGRAHLFQQRRAGKGHTAWWPAAAALHPAPSGPLSSFPPGPPLSPAPPPPHHTPAPTPLPNPIPRPGCAAVRAGRRRRARGGPAPQMAGGAACRRLQGLVQDCLAKHLYDSAIFFADKLVTLSDAAPAQVFLLAEVRLPPARCLQRPSPSTLVEMAGLTVNATAHSRASTLQRLIGIHQTRAVPAGVLHGPAGEASVSSAAQLGAGGGRRAVPLPGSAMPGGRLRVGGLPDHAGRMRRRRH